MSSLDNRTLAIVGTVILIAVGFIIFNPFNNDSNSSDNMSDGQIAVIETNFGNIVIQLFPDVAPGHVENFVKLARDGFYDGSTFHRVIPGFMIQGGDPTGTGAGGPGYQFGDEFVSSLKHDSEGILSMANAGPGTNGSQFFITHAPTPHLDGAHTIFGKVVSGMEVEPWPYCESPYISSMSTYIKLTNISIFYVLD